MSFFSTFFSGLIDIQFFLFLRKKVMKFTNPAKIVHILQIYCVKNYTFYSVFSLQEQKCKLLMSLSGFIELPLFLTLCNFVGKDSIVKFEKINTYINNK